MTVGNVDILLLFQGLNISNLKTLNIYMLNTEASNVRTLKTYNSIAP